MLTPPAAVEAILFVAGEPVEKKDLAQMLGITEAQLAVALKGLAADLSRSGLSLIETDANVELRTSPQAADLVKKLWETERSRDLGKASLETLAVIAYRSDGAGATRGEVDWVRGVNSSASIRTLQLRGLIEGREDPSDKRRIRYALATEALAHLGLETAHALPRYAELAKGAEEMLAEVRTPDALASEGTFGVPESNEI